MPLITLDQDQLSQVVAETVRQAINGLVRFEQHAQKNGAPVKLNIEGQEFQFQFQITAPNGINAVTRTNTTTPGEQTSVVDEPETSETSTTEPRENTSRTEESGRTDTTGATEDQSATERQEQAYGRTSETGITYEE